MSDETLRAQPAARRPDYGFQAWQATIGYISQVYSPDAMLTLNLYPAAGAVRWRAAASWGQVLEEVDDRPSLPAALRDLWREVDRNHTIFKSLEAAARRPVKYDESRWLDPDTQAALDRLVALAARSCGADWRLTFVYQPIENPSLRVQARLAARSGVHVGGRGGSLREACHELFRNAAGSL
ncbi:MAG: hypothetical protein ACUVSX_09430 [Aggregatilineales bacterium]